MLIEALHVMNVERMEQHNGRQRSQHTVVWNFMFEAGIFGTRKTSE